MVRALNLNPADNESIKETRMRRSHLEVALVFPHEPLYFEVIKSQVGIGWWRLQSYGEERKKQDEPPALSELFGVFLS